MIFLIFGYLRSLVQRPANYQNILLYLLNALNHSNKLHIQLKEQKMQPEGPLYQKIMKIGEGAYGAVYKARNRQTNEIVALKVTKFERHDEGVPSTTLREASILKSLAHRNIIKLLDIRQTFDQDQCTMEFAFEYMDEDLGKFIRRRKEDIELPEVKAIFRHIVEGVRYMHLNNVYHRDLKPQNILINSENEVKIGDFGLSRVVTNPDRTFSKEIETLWYRSPELLLGVKHYGTSVDIWSLGCILYELAEGKVLFKGDSQISQIFSIFELVGTPRISHWPGVISLPYFKKTFPKMSPKPFECARLCSKGIDLLKKMVEVNPEKRISMQQLIDHSFFG